MEAMIERGIYADELSKWDIDVVADSSSLHDIGKITISDSILNKKGSLTDTEFEKMKVHTTEGEKIIDGIISKTGNELFLQNAKLFAGHHHERWDGTGYPRGLKGTDISLQGRIMAVADVYDALVTVRPYKKAIPHDCAAEIIRKSSGSHFDPDIVDVFLEISGSLYEIVKKGDAVL
jgi:putative two-component system response regulator